MRITRVYTRTGDDGSTGLGGGQRVPKESPRIAAFGTVDELNSFIGQAIAGGLDETLAKELVQIQNDLFRVGSELCLLEEDRKRFNAPRVEAAHVERLERLIDRLQAPLGPLKEFILPGGAPGAAALHVARTACRRAERLVVALSRQESAGEFVIQYLNRLSDLLFVMARHENHARGRDDVYWDRTR
jgi:cob(I)alamin adenosyltransferase